MIFSGLGIIDVLGFQKYGGSIIVFVDFVIANFDVYDNGNYSCLVINVAGISESGIIVLIVIGSEQYGNFCIMYICMLYDKCIL